ncbi:hypothetical protein L332_08155 [Agrococcus pavilionensis RW1]|uniref:Glucosamine-6-phosphate deaminase n=1 Tax=Agrococcus pavilionensis RW1 TaxID=1330458 RepID=U1MUU9_9MICO|nr:glucosamine-6-phosphate deaminase [Agrococcus pavilionensis]ERG64420.1 hypothetical protein L332_08155 [Agrococcus pavilionensis RW1]
MEIVIARDAAAVGELAADAIVAALGRRSEPVLGVATGSSPLTTYRALALRPIEWRTVAAFALDEYVGLPEEHPQSYHRVIDVEVTQRLGLDPGRVHVPNGNAGDLSGECERFERAIRDAGGVDVQILGIGSNGHIGFNEPASSFGSRTRIKTLTPRTRRDNARFFSSPEEVPVHCITQGLGTIMDARRVVLVATGDRKAAAVAAMVEGPVSARVPASILQHHRHATIVVDEAAAEQLAGAEYYRFIQEQKHRLSPADDV